MVLACVLIEFLLLLSPATDSQIKMETARQEEQEKTVEQRQNVQRSEAARQVVTLETVKSPSYTHIHTTHTIVAEA